MIGARPFSLITDHLDLGRAPTAPALKLAVLERHGRNGNIGRGWVTGFGPLRGAIASSIGHDSHNLIVAGDDEADMAVAVNHLIELQGGAVVVRDGRVLADLPLPVAGLMSDRDFDFVETRLRPLRAAAAACGCTMSEPVLQLAFLPLPVIPHLKLTDRGYVAAGPDGLRLLPGLGRQLVVQGLAAGQHDGLHQVARRHRTRPCPSGPCVAAMVKRSRLDHAGRASSIGSARAGLHLDLDQLAVLAVDHRLPAGDRLVPEAQIGHGAQGGVVAARRPAHRELAVADFGHDERVRAVVVGPDPGPDQHVVLPDVLARLLVAVGGDERDLDREVEPVGRPASCRSLPANVDGVRADQRALAEDVEHQRRAATARPARTKASGAGHRPSQLARVPRAGPMRSRSSSLHSSAIGCCITRSASARKPVRPALGSAHLLDPFDPGGGRAGRQSVDHRPHRPRLRREHGLDRTVGTVAHPAVEPERRASRSVQARNQTPCTLP